MIAQPSSADRLATRILVGMVVGLVLGGLLRGLFPWVEGLEVWARWGAGHVLTPVGNVFLRMLFFVIVPLIFASLALGVAQLGDLRRLGPLAGRTFGMFFLNMAVGIGLGLLMMNLLRPGERIEPAMREALVRETSARVEAVQQRSEELTAERRQGVLRMLVEMFMPANLLQAVVGSERGRIGDVLPLILFAILVGAAGTQLGAGSQVRLRAGLQIVAEVMMRIVHWALVLAPYAVAAMMARVVIEMGFQFLGQLLLFTGGVLGVMLVHLFGTMSVLLRVLSRQRPLAFFKAIRAVLITAFSTSSSNATLPTSIQVSQEVLGVSPSVAGFVLPLGATMNMSGTALYEGCVVLFVAQVYGVPLHLGQQLLLLLLAVLSAVAVAGIPGASLPLIVGLLTTFGVPPEGIALVLGVDRLLDMARTTLNVAADVVTAVIVEEQVGGAGEQGSAG